MTREEIKDILELHRKWLRMEEGGVKANLSEVDLYGADLSEANLLGADLQGANLHGAKNLEKAINFLFPIRCPKTGSFTAYKKAVMGNLEFVIIQLTIPATAKRSSATGEKCRASQAKVENFYDLNGEVIDIKQVFSLHDREFVYEIGKVVEPTEAFCEDRWNECASGIHFLHELRRGCEILRR